MTSIDMGVYVRRYAFWNPATWSIPSLYWDVFSEEQRWHAICKQLGKVIQYADYLGVNVDDIAGRLKAIEEGQLDDLIKAEIEAWFEDNQPAIVEAIAQLQEDVAGLTDEVNGMNDVLTALKNKTKQLDFNCRFRRIAASNMDTAYNNSCQGMTMFELSNTRILAQAYVIEDDAKISLYGYDTNSEIDSITGAYGHLNDLAYKDGKIYALAEAAGIIYVFDVTAHSITYNSSFTVPETCSGIAYNATLDKWFLASTLGEGLGIDVSMYSNDFTEKISSVNIPFNGRAVIQGIHVTDNAYYVALTEPNTIIYADLEVNDYFYINAPVMVGHCFVDEVEGVYADENDNLFFNTNSNVDFQLLCSVFETNLLHNVEKEVDSSVQQNRYYNITANVDAINGDLVSPGEYGHSFMLAGDALNYAKNLGIDEVSLVFAGDYPYPIVANGSNFSINNPNDFNVNLNGIYIRFCTLLVNNVNKFVLNLVDSPLFKSGSDKYAGVAAMSRINIGQGTWVTPATPYGDNEYQMRITNSIASIQSTSYYSFYNCIVSAGSDTPSASSVYDRTVILAHVS